MGIEAVKVLPQTEPIRLELLGTTEYDSENQTRIRPLFKGRVDKVHARVGDFVKKGDPLIEFYSTELADAKNACEIERIQWVYDHNLLTVREELWKNNSIAEQLYLETKNDEMKSRESTKWLATSCWFTDSPKRKSPGQGRSWLPEGPHDLSLARQRHRDLA